MMALIRLNVACIARLAASATHPSAESTSIYRRFQRFFQQVFLNPVLICRLILNMLGVGQQKVLLIFDRTNFKRGQKHINVLFLAMVHHRMAIPLAWKCLPETQKQGNSSPKHRRELLDMVIESLGNKDRIWAILGDREFLGKAWLKTLEEQGIAYCVRLKEKWQCIKKDQASVPLLKLLASEPGIAQELGFIPLGTHKAYICKLTGKRLSKDKALVLAHSDDIQEADELYRFRWQIEHLFKSLKSSGFNFESTGLTHAERINTLVSCIAIALTAAFVEGLSHPHAHTRVLKKHGYPLKTYFRWGLERLQSIISRSFKKALSRLYQLIFPKKSFFIPLPNFLESFFVV